MSLNIDFNKFYLPENIKYTTNWLNSKLYKTRIEQSLGPTNENMIELPQQTYIRNYFNINSPYRGILLFHGLGTGKSCTSITTAENLKKNHHIFILTPASLQTNWEDEIINKCGDINYKDNINLFYKYYTLIKYNSSDISKIYTKYQYNYYIGDTIDFIYNTKNYNGKIIEVEGIFNQTDYIIEIYTIDISNKTIIDNENNTDNILIINKDNIKIINDNKKNVFSNKVVIIDEIHNLISMYKKDDIEYNSEVVLYRNKTYTDLINCINSKIILLSGTPIINNIIELKYILNILHGINTFMLFKLNILTNDIVNINELKNYILENNKFINAIDIKYEKSIIYINILKLIDYFRKNDNYVSKVNYIYTVKNLVDDVSELIMLYFGNKNIDYNVLEISPINQRKFIETNDFDFEQIFIEKEVTETFDMEIKEIKNILYLKTLLIGKISYLQSEKTTQQFEHNLYLELEADQLTVYNLEREKEITYGLKAGKNSDDTSKLRASSRQMCLIGIKGMTEELAEKDMKNKSKLIEMFLKKIPKNINKLDEFIKRYSIKYYTLINIINNPKNKNYIKGKLLIYSEYRELGVKFISILLELYKYHSIISYFNDINKYFVNDKISEEGKLLIQKDIVNIKNHYNVFGIYNANTDAKHLRENKFMKYIYDLPENDDGKLMRMIFITKSGSEGLSFKSIRQVHIMDTFWHLTRKRQVIGRGIRYGSHDRLPANMRNVNVYNYIATFPKNIKLSDNITRYDKGLTSDEYIIKNATNKQIVIDKIYNIIESVAIDCPYNFDDNYSIKCMNYPLKSEDNLTIYNPFTLSVHKQEQIFRRAKLIQINGTNYICFNNNIYDYKIYSHNNSYITVGNYIEKNNKIEFNILDKQTVSITMDIKTFHMMGESGANAKNKLYISTFKENDEIILNKQLAKIISKNSKFLIIKYINTVQIIKKYIYNDNKGNYIIIM
jgi:hypothetical protein